MPRRPFGTGNVPAVPPLDSEEVKFWLHIMEEHALFIKTGLPADKKDLIEEATSFEREFKALRVRAEKNLSEKKFVELVTDTMGSLKEFIRYKRLLLELSFTNKLGSALPPLFFDHLIREAEYFMAILTKLRAGKKLAVVKALEADFWLRIMAEHTKFIGSRIDPSERSLIDVDRGYEVEFDNLYMQGRDYVSFFEHQPMELPAFGRFLQDSRAATVRLRDFKQAVYDMIIKNRMLSTVPAVMADHVRREADHFLLVLAMMEKGIIKVEKDCVDSIKKHHTKYDMIMDDEFVEPIEEIEGIEDIEIHEHGHLFEEEAIDDMELDFTPGLIGREKEPPSQAVADQPGVLTDDREEPEEENTPKVQGEVKEVVTEEVVTPPPKPAYKYKAQAPPAPPKNDKQPKYKWGGSLPRQLGKITE
ncbi:hypothetical protein SCACP_40150 [Sporomusa carbonis]